MLKALKAFRETVKPILPSGGHKALRTAFYGTVLPVMRGFDRVREGLGADFGDPPPPSVLAQYGLEDPAQYKRVGGKEARSIIDALAHADRSLPDTARVLDFGCGAAGAMSALHEMYPKAKIYGCDIKGDVIGWVERNRPQLTVSVTEPMPPLPDDYADFDLVYAISVWTHMPPEVCMAWLRHMHERLNPSGALVMTVVPPDHPIVRRHGFDPATLPAVVRAAGGCYFDPGKDMSYIDREWFEAQDLFDLRHFGPPSEIKQQIVVLTKRA